MPHVAAVPKVREWMKKTQRECGKFGNLVMEGRDIGTNVFPETDFKFFLDAPPEARRCRRLEEDAHRKLDPEGAAYPRDRGDRRLRHPKSSLVL